VGGDIWLYNKSLSGLADPFAIVNTAKCPRLRCWMREQAAVFSCECLGERLIRETFKKAAVALLYIFGYKDTIKYAHTDVFSKIFFTRRYSLKLKSFFFDRDCEFGNHIISCCYQKHIVSFSV